MVWKNLDTWVKGWTIGFAFGIIQPLLFIGNYFAQKQSTVLLIPASLLTGFTNLLVPCTDCQTRLYYILFSSPFIYGILGIIIAILISGVKGTKTY
ncbi:hypothetical protein HYT51_00175 [Candidatus Woesearchaeota archaeon]|nr:hypothetical protein [Candidatus Woesearchaeota archaeon]